MIAGGPAVLGTWLGGYASNDVLGVLFFAVFFAAFAAFAAFNHVAVGIALTFATVAATTLAA